ncbi:hypothetical protein OCU04_010325 [Sclerotinia nivalis]|uniref:Uncharacterized protein n=1 Tax=Sclerotinia nivalis TaxID=352851 RepID=A0A9X0AEH7_9HELO|nr:hypothetical protein OCU04_010325 [Sclerotinia nivalis]
MPVSPFFRVLADEIYEEAPMSGMGTEEEVDHAVRRRSAIRIWEGETFSELDAGFRSCEEERESSMKK